MAFTYSGDPRKSLLDEVRYLSGDTDSTKAWTLHDAEILYELANSNNNALLAASHVAEAIVGKLKAIPESKRVGDLSLTWGSQFKFFSDRVNQLRARAALGLVKPYIGGTSLAEKLSQNEDGDRVQPAAKVDGMSYPLPKDVVPPGGSQF